MQTLQPSKLAGLSACEGCVQTGSATGDLQVAQGNSASPNLVGELEDVAVLAGIHQGLMTVEDLASASSEEV